MIQLGSFDKIVTLADREAYLRQQRRSPVPLAMRLYTLLMEEDLALSSSALIADGRKKASVLLA